MTREGPEKPSTDVAALASTVATTSHESLDQADVDAFEAVLDDVDAAMTAEEYGTAGDTLHEFWDAYLAAGLREREESADADAFAERVEQGFAAELVGIDIYQALQRFAAVRTDEAPDSSTYQAWTKRVLALTRDHHAHLADHLG
ncbi:hypothetical protein ACFQH6_15695 [Halobacteriaceae archaeon GCM10025711]